MRPEEEVSHSEFQKHGSSYIVEVWLLHNEISEKCSLQFMYSLMLNWLVPVLKNNVVAKTQLAEGAKGF